ncbi:MAG: hypothetical protein AAFU71_10215, partial [Cyanobacteria bacterium J06632_22]
AEHPGYSARHFASKKMAQQAYFLPGLTQRTVLGQALRTALTLKWPDIGVKWPAVAHKLLWRRLYLSTWSEW